MADKTEYGERDIVNDGSNLGGREPLRIEDCNNMYVLKEGKGGMGCSPGADRLGDCVIAEPGCWLEPCLSKASQIVGNRANSIDTELTAPGIQR